MPTSACCHQPAHRQQPRCTGRRDGRVPTTGLGDGARRRDSRNRHNTESHGRRTRQRPPRTTRKNTHSASPITGGVQANVASTRTRPTGPPAPKRRGPRTHLTILHNSRDRSQCTRSGVDGASEVPAPSATDTQMRAATRHFQGERVSGGHDSRSAHVPVISRRTASPRTVWPRQGHRCTGATVWAKRVHLPLSCSTTGRRNDTPDRDAHSTAARHHFASVGPPPAASEAGTSEPGTSEPGAIAGAGSALESGSGPMYPVESARSSNQTVFSVSGLYA